MTSEILCPCCLRPLEAGQTVEMTHLLDARMPAQHRTLIEALIKAYPRRVTLDHLVDRLYGDDIDGGPDDPKQVIRAHVVRLRKKLPKYGWTIPKNNSGRGVNGTYRLEALKEPQ